MKVRPRTQERSINLQNPSVTFTDALGDTSKIVSLTNESHAWPLRQRFMEARQLLVPSPTQAIALELYGLGLNVFPQPYGRKAGYPHRRLRQHRLYYHPGDARSGDLIDVTSERCNLALYTGRTSRNLFVFDCETTEALSHLVDQLQRRGVTAHWIVASPSEKGGGHLYFRSEEGELENIEPGVHRDLEVRAQGRYVLTVGSKHPDPADYRQPLYLWQRRDGSDVPTVMLAQVNDLLDLDGKPIHLHVKRRKGEDGRPPIYVATHHSKTTAEYLRTGHTLQEGGRRTALFAAALDYARCNYSGYPRYRIEDAETDLALVAWASGLPEGEITRAIREAYAMCNCGTYKAKGARTTMIHDWQYALAFCDHHAWKGRTAATDRAVFLALIERARLGGNSQQTFRAAYRELAENACVKKDTVASATKRLQRASPPLICYAGQDGGQARVYRGDGSRERSHETRASLWRFSDYVVREGRKVGEIGTVRSTHNGLSSSVPLSPSSDAAERGALGAQGWHVYCVMLSFDQPATLKQIAERAELTVEQVRYHVVGKNHHGKRDGGKLLDVALVCRNGRLFEALPATPEQLDQKISVPYGTYGKGMRRKTQHEVERAIYTGKLMLLTRESFKRTGQETLADKAA